MKRSSFLGGLTLLIVLLSAYGCSSSEPGDQDNPAQGAESLACAKEELGSFQPKWQPPIVPLQKKCTADQRNQLFDACVGAGSTEKKCEEFKAKTPENAACAACVITDESAAAQGPVIASKKLGTLRLNVAGCIAATSGDAEGKGCGAKVQAAEQCEDTVCGECPTKEEASMEAYRQCTESARTGLCKTYAEKASCADPQGGAGADPLANKYIACLKGDTLKERFESVTSQLCGGI